MMDFIFFPTKDVYSELRSHRRSFLEFYKHLCTLLFTLEILRRDRGAGCPDDLHGTAGCPNAFNHASATIVQCYATAHTFLSGRDIQDLDALKFMNDVNKDRNMASAREERADNSANDFATKVGRTTYPLCFPGASFPVASANVKTPARKSKKPSGSHPAKKSELSSGEKQAVRRHANSLMKDDVEYPKGMFNRILKQLESAWPRSKDIPPTSAVGQEMAAAEAKPREAGANYKKKSNRGADAPAGGN
mgnify:CR=1 FL=1